MKREKTYVSFAGIKILIDPETVGERHKVKVAVRPEDFVLDSNGGEFNVVTQLPTGPSQILNLEKGSEDADNGFT